MNPIIKLIIYAILYYGGFVSLFLKLFPHTGTNFPIVILVYHRIVKDVRNEINSALTINHPEENFTLEMGFLKKWFNIISLDEAVGLLKRNKLPAKPTVVITFDDGFDDNYSVAFPILKFHGIPATIFLTAAYIDGSDLPWVDKIDQAIVHTKRETLKINHPLFHNIRFLMDTLEHKRIVFEMIIPRLKVMDEATRRYHVNEIIKALGEPTPCSRRLLTWQEIREMSEHGISVGAHTMTHPILSRMPLEEAKQEIYDSKEVIERSIEMKVKHFAYPNGRAKDFNKKLGSYCRKVGFESIASVVRGANRSKADIQFLRRVTPGKNMPAFAIDLIRAFYR